MSLASWLLVIHYYFLQPSYDVIIAQVKLIRYNTVLIKEYALPSLQSRGYWLPGKLWSNPQEFWNCTDIRKKIMNNEWQTYQSLGCRAASTLGDGGGRGRGWANASVGIAWSEQTYCILSLQSTLRHRHCVNCMHWKIHVRKVRRRKFFSHLEQIGLNDINS